MKCNGDVHQLQRRDGKIKLSLSLPTYQRKMNDEERQTNRHDLCHQQTRTLAKQTFRKIVPAMVAGNKKVQADNISMHLLHNVPACDIWSSPSNNEVVDDERIREIEKT